MGKRWGWLLAISGLLVGSVVAYADVRLHGLFTDGMVLQRGTPVPIWGSADPGENVRVEFLGQKAETTAKNGHWRVVLKELPAGGPHTLTVTGKNTIRLKNVYVGEVWICSGQSNMEWPLQRTVGAEQAIAQSHNPLIRLYTVPRRVAATPQKDVTGQWKECGPDTVATFSAVGYYFGRDLQRSLGVPIGLIKSAWGGTPAESWTSLPVLESTPGLELILQNYARRVQNYPMALIRYRAALERHALALKKAKAQGKRPPRPPRPPRNPETHSSRPAGLYNGMIAPLIPFAFRGVIWYQGESNASRAYEYRTLFPAMIRNWRKDWGRDDFPFLFVQLAPFRAIVKEPTESAWAELRDAQLFTMKTVPNTAMAVITDVGDEKDIHPRRKEPVGARLALAARALAYGEPIVYSGPIYKSMTVQGNKAIIHFDHVGSGLVAKGGPLQGFTIAGKDRRFYNADAHIVENTVIVSSPKVDRPVAVRFGWANYPVVNLWNREGLPASPFRTDDFPMITQPKTTSGK